MAAERLQMLMDYSKPEGASKLYLIRLDSGCSDIAHCDDYSMPTGQENRRGLSPLKEPIGKILVQAALPPIVTMAQVSLRVRLRKYGIFIQHR